MSNPDNYSVLSAVDDQSVAEFISDSKKDAEISRKITHAVKDISDLWILAKMVQDARQPESRPSFKPMHTN